MQSDQFSLSSFRPVEWMNIGAQVSPGLPIYGFGVRGLLVTETGGKN